jgi:hypothetical protein
MGLLGYITANNAEQLTFSGAVEAVKYNEMLALWSAGFKLCFGGCDGK